MQGLSRVAGLMLILIGPAARVTAEPLTFYFEGYVDFIHDYLDLDESIAVGTTFSGGYTFDPIGATDLYPDDPQTGNYYFGPPARLWAEIGNYEFVTPDLIMFIADNWLSGDIYQAASVTPFVAAGYQWGAMRVALIDATRTALDSDALVTTVPDLEDFGHFRGLQLFLPGDSLGIGGTLTSLTPEPGSLVLFVLGAVALARRQRS